MRILIYFPSNARAIDLLSLMEMFVEAGHRVSLLTQTEKGDLHRLSEALGVETFSYAIEKSNPAFFYAKHARFLIRLCRERDIDIVFSHLYDTGLACVFASPFLKAKIYYVRHNADEGKLLSPKKASIINWMTNRFLPKIISPSTTVYRYLTEVEKVPSKKIVSINYGYNFEMYKIDKTGIADQIRGKFQCRMLIVSVCRLISVKRHPLMLEAVESLLNEGLDIKWICVGTGDLLEEYRNLIVKKGLSDRIHFLGFQKNVADYLEAADVFLHLSETEASNSAVKEAGLEKLPVIVCRGVGDFEEYVKTDKNGFVVDKENPVPETIRYLRDLYDHPSKIRALGEKLCQTVHDEFDIDNVRGKYKELFESI